MNHNDLQSSVTFKSIIVPCEWRASICKSTIKESVSFKIVECMRHRKYSRLFRNNAKTNVSNARKYTMQCLWIQVKCIFSIVPVILHFIYGQVVLLKPTWCKCGLRRMKRENASVDKESISFICTLYTLYLAGSELDKNRGLLVNPAWFIVRLSMSTPSPRS